MNLPDPAVCYDALRSRDARFDGRLFVGVASTRIYCRPVCRVRTPLARNCRFFNSAAAAEAAGFRPCLRCRPELAPGYAAVDAQARLARRAAALIEAGPGEGGLEAVASRLGVTARHLRRVFDAEFGVSPVDYLQTQRLLLAKRLLTDTALPVTEVALAAGFGSLRRFNALFQARYRMNPTRLRAQAVDASPLSKRPQGPTSSSPPPEGVKQALGGPAPASELRFLLAYRPPYDWDWVLGFLAARTIAGVESVAEGAYRRVVAFDEPGVAGWVEVRRARKGDLLEVRVAPSLARRIPELIARVRRVFDLDARPEEIAAGLGAWAGERPGIRLPGGFDGFELAARAILGQQVSVKAAHTLAGRVAARFGPSVEMPFEGLSRAFPTPDVLAAAAPEDVAALGIVRQRAAALVSLARAIAEGRLALDPAGDVDEALAALRALPGIGDWTAQYVAMRALGWPDAFPASDLVLMRALDVRTPKAALAAAEAWRPWRGYAVMHLWSGARPQALAEPRAAAGPAPAP
ncbi:MAG: hypothetical protein RIS35_2081 [Pseudomonadota bacterium]